MLSRRVLTAPMLLVGLFALTTAGCGGGSGSPGVANLGTPTTTTASQRASSRSPRGSTEAVASGDPSQLLNDWAACMRRHGDPHQADPSIDSHKVIHITWNVGIPGGYNGTNKGGQGNLGPGQYCRSYLTAAQSALRAGSPAPTPPNQAQLVKYSECMRAHGIPDFPDPTAGGGLQLNMSGDTNPQDPSFERASRICTAKTGAHVFVPGGTLPPGTITLGGALPPGTP